MVCGTQLPIQPNVYTQIQIVHAEQASAQASGGTHDFNDEAAEEDCIPHPLTLKRCSTLTEYNDSWQCEWTRPLAQYLPCAAMPAVYPLTQHATVPATPSYGFVAAAALLNVPNTPSCVSFDVDSTHVESGLSTYASRESSPDAKVPALEPRGLTHAEKEVKKLQKKLNAIIKIQERLEAGEKLDKLQLEKLTKRHVVEQELLTAQNAADQEEVELSRAGAEGSAVVEDNAHAFHAVTMPNAPQYSPCHYVPAEQSYAQLLQALESPGSLRDAAILYLRGRVQDFTFDVTGCRVVQLALDVADKDAAAALASELHGCVQDALQSPYGNYVIQKAVVQLPNAVAGFVAQELRGAYAAAARHRYGCRILCRLFEYAASFPETCAIVDELMRDIISLSRHTFGHHVVQTILSHGLAQHKAQIARALLRDVVSNVQDRNSAYVIESALTHCACADQEALIGSVLGKGLRNVPVFIRSMPGIHVLRALMKLQCKTYLLECLQQLVPEIRKSGQGHRLLQDMKYAQQAAA